MQSKHHFNYYTDGVLVSVTVICNWTGFREGSHHPVNYFGRAVEAACYAAEMYAGKEVGQANSYYFPAANETWHARRSPVIAELNV